MIFSLRQLQEKCIEQNRSLYVTFVDLTKAFDTVGRAGLWKLLPKLGCPPRLTQVIRQFHDGMKGRVNIGGELSESFPINNGVKQGCVLAPALFGLFFASVLEETKEGLSSGVYIQNRSDGALLNLSRLRAKSKVRELLVTELQFADDCALVAHTEEDLQEITTRFANAAKNYGLTISLNKTEVLAQPPPGHEIEKPKIMIDGFELKSVDHFCYLGSYISANGSLDKELQSRIGKACASFGKLEKRLWSQNIKMSTKCLVYRAVVLSALLYGSETWTPYQRHLKKLDQLQQRHLRSILKITWRDKVSNVEVLNRAKMPAASTLVMSEQLRWSGHTVRMKDGRLPKDILYGQLSAGIRRRGRPKLRFKDTLHANLKKAKISTANWETLALNRVAWKSAIRSGTKTVEGEMREAAHRRHVKRHSQPEQQPTDAHVCGTCNKACRSRIGLFSHQKRHK